MTDQNRNDDERKKEAPSGHSAPIDPPVPDEERYRLDRDRERTGVTDAGRTSGGGSLGHVQPDKVEREAPLRNNADHRKSDEPTLPSNDASLNTKI